MILLPEGFSLPPLPYLLGLLVVAGSIGYGLYRRRLPVTPAHVLAFAPWIAVGSCLHVLYVIGGLPSAVRPLGGTAAVYLTASALAGGVWLTADRWLPSEQVPMAIGATGLLAVGPIVGGAVVIGARRGTLAVRWPTIAVIAAVAVTALAWLALRRRRPAATDTTGEVGLLALFGHMVDAVSTAVGIDVLGFGERTPLSRWIIGFAERLPTAETLGSGWLFVLVKLAVISGVVVLFADYIDDEPTEGYLLLGIIAAVGLGPGVHNLLLFAVAGG